MNPRLFDNRNNIEQQIKDTFYNSLADFVLSLENVTRDSLPQLLLRGIRHTIQAIIRASEVSDGIRLPTGVAVTNANCPVKYKALFDVLLLLKQDKNLSDEKIDAITAKIVQLDSFRDLNPTQFLLEALGLANPVQRNVQYDEMNVTPQLIRETFYNEMVIQTLLAVQNEWLTIDDLEEEEPQVYLALPALTILEAIQQSQQCDGIRLLNGKVVNAHNCPNAENFPVLVKLILSVKDKIAAMNDEQLNVVKHMVACDKELPDALKKIKTPELMATVAVIKDMAIEITRRQVFHNMIATVLELCLSTLKPPVSSIKPQ